MYKGNNLIIEFIDNNNNIYIYLENLNKKK